MSDSSQIALPLAPANGAETIVVSPALQPVIDGLLAAQDWPIAPASCRGRRARARACWPAGSDFGAGDAVDDADLHPEDEVFHLWNRAQASGRPLLLVNNRGPGNGGSSCPISARGWAGR
jgi:hypothetical protein